ncbi:hypothetical protein DSO57_1031174 [Entomophthora muscae]|uniref:Uncharacterized protein n=1 Tax=Entomophthora muscae TaxID=34485 RepID=A0ACC2RRM6_9FUNG|nr:hypothetical protein DSO57_1031174 [Entomophthora muscae]
MIQVPSEDPVLYIIARHPNKLLHRLSTSGLGCRLNLIDKFKLTTNPLWIKKVVLADEHNIAVTKETAPFSVMLENLHSTIQGPVIDFPKFEIMLGLDCLQKNNPQPGPAPPLPPPPPGGPPPPLPPPPREPPPPHPLFVISQRLWTKRRTPRQLTGTPASTRSYISKTTRTPLLLKIAKL